jgi:hypothetical protein
MDLQLDITKILLIFVILLILGINVFYYLARTTDFITTVGEKGVSEVVDVTKSVVRTAGEGTRFGVDVAEGTISSGLDILDKTIGSPSQLTPQQPLQPDDSDSPIQVMSKKGYCYIGSEGKNRKCISVGVNDLCMSGDIYPSMAICMNPNLRA